MKRRSVTRYIFSMPQSVRKPLRRSVVARGTVAIVRRDGLSCSCHFLRFVPGLASPCRRIAPGRILMLPHTWLCLRAILRKAVIGRARGTAPETGPSREARWSPRQRRMDPGKGSICECFLMAQGRQAVVSGRSLPAVQGSHFVRRRSKRWNRSEGSFSRKTCVDVHAGDMQTPGGLHHRNRIPLSKGDG
jgi:hypothetical protein